MTAEHSMLPFPHPDQAPMSAFGAGPRAGHTVSQGREAVQVTYYPVLKDQSLGRRLTSTIPARRGENPVKAAERALRRRYKVRDFVILEAHLAQTGFWDRTAERGGEDS